VSPEERQGQRLAFWLSLGADKNTAQELEALCRPLPPPQAQLPVPEEPQTSFYRQLPKAGWELWQALLPAFPQLAFSPAPGLRESQAWASAVRRGQLPAEPGCPLAQAQGLELQLVPTLAGPVPALITSCRQDFVLLVRLLAHRGEPVPVPESMGACLVQGLVNWQRFRAWKGAWEEEKGAESWELASPQLAQAKHQYQDRLVLASRGPYSGLTFLPGWEPSRWEEVSLAIRLAHEGTHYLTLRLFHKLGHSLLEEVVADWVGLASALGAYDPQLASAFFGLEAWPHLRLGGRLSNYRPAGITDAAFAFLAQAVHLAIGQLAQVPWPDPEGLARLLPQLLAGSLEELACGNLAEEAS